MKYLQISFLSLGIVFRTSVMGFALNSRRGLQRSALASAEAESKMDFAAQIYSKKPTETRAGVEFLNYDESFLSSSQSTAAWDTKELLLFLPGLDFTGVSAAGTFPSLASEFDLWWCRVPGEDRTPFNRLAETIKEFIIEKGSENRPVTLLGESFGGLLALGVAQRLLDDEVNLRGLVLVNPATSFSSSPWPSAGPLLASLPSRRFGDIFDSPVKQLVPPVSFYSGVSAAVLAATVPDTTQVIRGVESFLKDIIADGGLQAPTRAQQKGEQALDALDAFATRLGPSTLQFRLDHWLADGCKEVNPQLSLLANKVPVLVLAGEEDRMLPSPREANRLLSQLGKTSSAYVLAGVGHAALDGRVDIIPLMKNSTLFNKVPDEPEIDYVRDFQRPNSTTIERADTSLQRLRSIVSPVFVSTDQSGRVASGLTNVPVPQDLGRPVLLVGNHQLLALDLGLLISQFLGEKDTLPRGLAHPVVFRSGPPRAVLEEGTGGAFSPGPFFRRVTGQNGRTSPSNRGNEGDSNSFNGVGDFREFGAVPVNPRNFFNLMKGNEMALLFPGGVRESNHGRGEDYMLFWPPKADFVRVAARFNAVIVPFGAVGAADSVEIVADAADMQTLPIVGTRLREAAQAVPAARRAVRSAEEEPENFAFPLSLPSPRGPDRFYFCFGQPFDTANLDHRNKIAVNEAYSHIKGSVEDSIEYLLKEREKDPYRPLIPRLAFERINAKQAPSFPLSSSPVKGA